MHRALGCRLLGGNLLRRADTAFPTEAFSRVVLCSDRTKRTSARRRLARSARIAGVGARTPRPDVRGGEHFVTVGERDGHRHQLTSIVDRPPRMCAASLRSSPECHGHSLAQRVDWRTLRATTARDSLTSDPRLSTTTTPGDGHGGHRTANPARHATSSPAARRPPDDRGAARATPAACRALRLCRAPATNISTRPLWADDRYRVSWRRHVVL